MFANKKGLIVALWLVFAACAPRTAIMVIETLDGTKYARVAVMDKKESCIIKLKNAKEGEIREIKVKQLKQTQ